MTLMHILLVLIGAALLCITLPLVMELFILSIAALVKAPPLPSIEDSEFPLAVIIPAHNEEKLIHACVTSLRTHSSNAVAIYVIAHNCTDRTAQLAEAAGAHVLVLNDDGQKGKGAALLYGFAQSLERGAQAVMVIDADSTVSALLTAQCQAAFRAGADAVQCRYLVANSNATDRTRLIALGFLGINVLRPRGRHRLGLSCGIFGNGFALSAATLRAVPYLAHSVVEDLEYHLLLVRSGRRVLFMDSAAVYGEMPDNNSAAATQRARWEGGRARMRRHFALPLASRILRGQVRLLEPLLDLLTFPIATGAAVLAATLLLPLSTVRIYAACGLFVVLLYVTVSASLSSQPLQTWKALASVPRYLVAKILLIPSTHRAAKAQAEWVRTERNQDK